MSFVHLHLHSQYSLLEATCRPADVAQRARQLKMPAVAQTDLGNMFGALEFYFACQKAEVKPILGLEVYLAPGSRHQKSEDRNTARRNLKRLVLLAQDLEGYRSLCRISTVGYQEGFYYKPRVDDEVLAQNNTSLIALSGGYFGDVAQTFLHQGPDGALERIKELQKLFKDRFYLEINETGVPLWKELAPFLMQVGEDLGIPVVAAGDVHYLHKEDQLAQETLICIGTNKTLKDESRFRLGSDQFYFRSAEEMQALMKPYPGVCERTLEVAERCNVEFKLKDAAGHPIYHLPTFPTEEGRSLKEDIRVKAFEGLEARFQEAAGRGEPISEEQKSQYVERLEHELQVIHEMGFNGYFLIVHDFIGWAKQNGIPVGPGRGSGAGSLVAYSLMITDLDPMPYNLIFERFLNPERVSMPDFDIDFCQERRGEVIDYVTEKYGKDSVSQIITYGRLQARAAVRDVGRVLGMAYAEVDAISKLIPEKLGITLKEALETEPRFKEQMELDPQVSNVMEMAQKIEGLVRHAGVHAAGVIIADGKLVDHAPLYRGAEGENVIQYDMKNAERIGLVKFDFLGLKTLTHINDCLALIQRNRGVEITTSQISLQDPGIYEVMSAGDTHGVFQFEGEGMTDTIKKIRPNCFEDIVAINSLYRPGPMDMIPEYTARKQGSKKVSYQFPELEPILQETYGVIIYQEQVQLIAARIANYSLGEADMLRRAMGKKIPEEMAAQKVRFLKGAQENNYDLEKAEELFDQMAEFAKYGFNKSHAAAYCVIAAQTAWLKRYYPVEFYAALLSTEMSDTDKIVKYVKHIRRTGIQVKPPHISHSDYKFSVRGEDIYFSLGAIKGVGQGAVEAIVEARSSTPSGAFESLESFFELVDLRRVNRKTIECLIKAGAMDDYGIDRATLLENYSKFLGRADAVQQDRAVGQGSLFSLVDEEDSVHQIVLTEAEPWPRRLALAYEKETLGFFLSDHPLNGMDHLFKRWVSCPIGDLGKTEGRKKVVVAGLVDSLREFITKKGTRMAFGALEDLTGQVELVIFPDVYKEFESDLKLEEPVLIAGALEQKEEQSKILVEKVGRFSEVLKKVDSLCLHVDSVQNLNLPDLHEILKNYEGDTPVYMEVDLEDIDRTVSMRLEKGVRVHPDLFEAFQQRLGRTDFIELRSS